MAVILAAAPRRCRTRMLAHEPRRWSWWCAPLGLRRGPAGLRRQRALCTPAARALARTTTPLGVASSGSARAAVGGRRREVGDLFYVLEIFTPGSEARHTPSPGASTARKPPEPRVRSSSSIADRHPLAPDDRGHLARERDGASALSGGVTHASNAAEAPAGCRRAGQAPCDSVGVALPRAGASAGTPARPSRPARPSEASARAGGAAAQDLRCGNALTSRFS